MTVRNKNKIFAENNDPNTVLVSSDLLIGKYVISAGNRNVKSFNPGAKKIMITDANGNAGAFDYGQANMLLVVNQSGNLQLVPRLFSTPPTGREFLVEVPGSQNPSAPLNSSSMILEPGWYEIEIFGAGGGGGAGRSVNDLSESASAFNGTKGGNGGYYKGTFLINIPQIAYFHPGNGGGGGEGYIYEYDSATGYIVGYGGNAGGAGGRQLVLEELLGSPNNGLDPAYSNNNTHPTQKLGGAGINAGPDGGKTEVDHSTIAGDGGIGGSGGGGNGPYGGAGGNSVYKNNTGLLNCFSGGAGGAGGGLGNGGRGGGDPKAFSYGAASGGQGATIPPLGKYYSAGGGGGGGASRFMCGNLVIIAGGGGGGAGAGYGGTNLSTPGGNGEVYGGSSSGSSNNGGAAGEGQKIPVPFPTNYYHNCSGKNGGHGRIIIRRCI